MIELCFFLIGISIHSIFLFPLADLKQSFPVLLLLQAILISLGVYFNLIDLVMLCMLILMDLYLLFYSKDTTYLKAYVINQCFLFILCYIFSNQQDSTLFIILFLTLNYGQLLLLQKRTQRFLFIGVGCFLLISIYLWTMELGLISIIIQILFCFFIELSYQRFSIQFATNTTAFQTQVMSHHYEEVKSVYLNMRGWRHDYHNHIQTLKAYLSMGKYPQTQDYLNQLENDLKQVDQLVKTGNLIVDAVLNSKLSIAKDQHIQFICKAIAPEWMSIKDIDICVILGNLLDNAIESCLRLTEDKRFIRVYIDIVRKQFYISITNAALEDLSFEEKNYISKKRGNHGHGMKRVKLTVDKYEGFMNLKNESGVFVSELMIPLQPIDEQKLPIRE